MRQRYDNIKRQEPKENQLGILKIYTFCQKVQQRALGPGQSTAGVTYLSMKIDPKSCRIFPRVIQLNCGEVRTYASHKTTRTWENFNNRGTRILLSDKLWSIVITSKSFSNESKSVIKNNLGLCKRSEIYLRTLKNSHGSNGMKI